MSYEKIIEKRKERCNAAALGMFNAAAEIENSADDLILQNKAEALAERTYEHFFRMADPDKGIKIIEKQYIERLKTFATYGRPKDEYTLATEIFYKKIGRKLPKI